MLIGPERRPHVKVDGGQPQGLYNDFIGVRLIIQREDMTNEAIASQD